MTAISLEEVRRIRATTAQAHALAAERFRRVFVSDPLVHLELQAAALMETARGVRAAGAIHYTVDGDRITPYVEEGKPLYASMLVSRTASAILEYWLIISEILSSSAWAVTKLIAEHGEYDDALRRMQSPQIVNALVTSFLPTVEMRDDGTALLTVVVYARAGEERVERRSLLLDSSNEFHFHSRELIAEGRGGIAV